MTKVSGLGDNFYVGGYNLSGDTNSLSNISGSMSPIDVTGIDKSAHERIGGLRDGAISWVTYFNNQNSSPFGEHVALSPLTLNDVGLMYCRGTTLGSPAAAMVSKQLNYDPTRSNTGELTSKVDAVANAFGLEWGRLLTAGVRTDTAATAGSVLDLGNGFTTPAVPLTTVPVTNTSPLPATVVISGGTVTTVLVGGVSAGSGDGTYVVPSQQTIAVTYSATPTWTWTLQTANGFQAYLQAFAFTGTDATVTLQGSTTSGGTYTNISSGAFVQLTAGRQTQRLAVGGTAVLPEFIKATTTTSGGFSSLQFAVMLVANNAAVSF